MPDIPTCIRLVALRVSDADASAEFYRRLTGLRVKELSFERALLAPGSGDPVLELIRAERGGRVSPGRTGLFHTAFRYPDRAGLGRALGRIASGVADLTGAADHGVSEALYLDDPDGHGIELYRDRPVAEWPEPQGPDERVGMYSRQLDLGGVAASAQANGSPGGESLDIGHVHLKVAEIEPAESFWTGIPGMELMQRFGPDATFLGRDGYHHHIGANRWHSGGGEPEPADGPGLERIEVATVGEPKDLTTPDGIAIRIV